MALQYPDSIQHNNPALPLVDDNQIGGGYRIVADKTARNAIPSGKRKVNALVAWVENSQNVIMRYDGADITDANWQNDSNWSMLSSDIANYCPYDEKQLLETEYSNYNQNAVQGTGSSEMSYYYKGTYNRIYFVIMDSILDAASATRTGHSNHSYVYFYDLDSKTFSKKIQIPVDFPSGTDTHNQPHLLVTDNGYIIVTRESMNPSGTHNSPIEIWRSNSPEKIESSTTPGTHDFTMVAYISGGTYVNNSYPNMLKGINSGEIMIFCRCNYGGHGNLVGMKSTDNGATWYSLSGTQNQFSLIANCSNMAGSGQDWYFYLLTCKGSREYGYHIMGIPNEGASGTSADGQPPASRYKFILHLYSADGVTWGNASFYNRGAGYGFSKNVVTSGNITTAELKANCVIVDVSTIANYSLDIQEACVGMDGSIVYTELLWTRYATASTPDYSGKANLQVSRGIRYFNTAESSWTLKDTAPLFRHPNDLSTEYNVFSPRPTLIAYNRNVIDLIGRRIYRKIDFHTPNIILSSTNDAIVGASYVVVTTQTDHFGEGIVVGDHIFFKSTHTLDENNTVAPLYSDVVIFRTYDGGDTWTILNIINLEASKFCSNSSAFGIIANCHDSGLGGVFIAFTKYLSGARVLDHSDIMLLSGEYLPNFDRPTPPAPALATVTTTDISNVTSSSADSGGNVTDDGGDIVTARGVCYNKTGTPTVSDSKTSNGIGEGEFLSNLTSLDAETLYYLRAYATNSVGTAYGTQKTFTTEAGPLTGYGYLAGGSNGAIVGTTFRIDFSTEVYAANTASNLSVVREYMAGISDLTNYGYVLGGLTATGQYSKVTDRITFSTGVAAANTASDLATARSGVSGISDGATYGYAVGGNTSATDFGVYADRITFSTGATAANTVSNLSTGRVYTSTGISDATTYGYFAGGSSAVSTQSKIADRITFSTGATAANTVSDLSGIRALIGAISDQVAYGYFGAGTTGASVATTDRITFSTGVTAANTVSNLSVAKYGVGAVSNGTTYGYFSGGHSGAWTLTTDRITFSTGATAAFTTSNLPSAKGLASMFSQISV